MHINILLYWHLKNRFSISQKSYLFSVCISRAWSRIMSYYQKTGHRKSSNPGPSSRPRLPIHIPYLISDTGCRKGRRGQTWTAPFLINKKTADENVCQQRSCSMVKFPTKWAYQYLWEWTILYLRQWKQYTIFYSFIFTYSSNHRGVRFSHLG
jgi:hypothetical protein